MRKSKSDATFQCNGFSIITDCEAKVMILLMHALFGQGGVYPSIHLGRGCGGDSLPGGSAWGVIHSPRSRDGHCRDRFASYWNVYLFYLQKRERATNSKEMFRFRSVWTDCEGPIWWDSLLCGAYGLIVTVNLWLCTLRHSALILLTSVFSRTRGPNFDTFSCPYGINVVFLRSYSSARSVRD